MLVDLQLERAVFQLVASQELLDYGCVLIKPLLSCLVDDSDPLGLSVVLLDHGGSPVRLQEVVPASLLGDEVTPVVLDSASSSLHLEVALVEADHLLKLSH